jgi:hypothetical protein
MKKIFTLILLTACQYTIFGQVAPVSTPKPLTGVQQNVKSCFVISNNTSALSLNDEASNKAREIIITRLPRLSASLTTVIIDIKIPGFFSFKKDKWLEIPYTCSVFIEDKLTGKMFNLESAGLYTFQVSQIVPNRFVMHILDKSKQELAVSSHNKNASVN